ncbi:OB-fold protein [Tenacibaculum aestuarii]|uniref:OB-fold protein n=1 Tax=Tenacibaculum aestuarii TaxID=362781 RepID=UPI003894A4C1
MKKILLHLASTSVLILFLFIAFGSMDENKSEASNQPSASEKIQADKSLNQAQKDSLLLIERQKEIETRENQTVSAKSLYYSYQQNEVSADNDFKNKWFYVEGIVDDIKKDFMDNIYVTLKTGEIIGSVQCFLDDANVASQLRKGQRITVYGKCSGLMMNVLMKKCKVVKNLSDLKK